MTTKKAIRQTILEEIAKLMHELGTGYETTKKFVIASYPQPEHRRAIEDALK